MFTQIALEIALIVFLVLANGIFAMSEIAVLSARKPRLQQQARSGSRRADIALRLAENPDRFLSTVQIGITLIGVFAGAFAGATIAEQIDQKLEAMPGLGPYSEVIGVGTVVLGITYLWLVLGELVPKRIALSAPERIAAVLAPAMNALSRVTAPAVYLLSLSTRAMLRILRVKSVPDPGVTAEEVRLLVHQGTKAGTIGREERDTVERVFRLGRRSVRAVMTPRVDVEWLDLARPIDALRSQASASAHGRFLVARGRVDAAEGVILVNDLWKPGVATTADLADHIRKPLFVPRATSTFSLLALFRERRNHFAVLTDEYGGIDGIVTPTDILEGLVGELPDTSETEEPTIIRRADDSWSIDASADLAEVATTLDLMELPGQKADFQTLGGYLVNRFGRLPRLGDSIEIHGFRFEILDVDGRRIDRVMISRIAS
jgi:putative hemolysin